MLFFDLIDIAYFITGGLVGFLVAALLEVSRDD